MARNIEDRLVLPDKELDWSFDVRSVAGLVQMP
jgi:hypothetical protein